MSTNIEKAFCIIEENAKMSGNEKAFMDGMVFGLGHSHEFIRRGSREESAAQIEVLLEMIDEKYFKPLEASPN